MSFTASATSFSCLPPVPVSLGKVILKQLLAFTFCLEGGCAYVLLLCNIKPTCQRDLALDWDPETQQSTEKNLSGIFLFIHWKCGSNCLMHASNTNDGRTHWYQGLFFTSLVWIFSSILYNKLFVLVSTIRRTVFRSISLSIALFCPKVSKI